MKKIGYYSAIIFWFVSAVACGGGGSSSTGGGTVDEKTITFTPGQAQELSFAGATLGLPGNCFAVPTTVRLKKTAAPSLAQTRFEPLAPELTITATSAQTAALTVTYPDNSQGQPVLGALLQNGQPIGALSVKNLDDRLRLTVQPSSQAGQQPAGSLPVTDLVIGRLTHYAPPNTKMGLQAIGSVGSGPVLIFVHGLLQNVETNRALLVDLGKQHHYGAVYSFSYDWRLGVDQAGQGLAEALRAFPAKQVDIIAYSKGGLVSRWALEKLGATKAVRRVMFLGVPNFGCNQSLATLYSLLGRWFLSEDIDVQAVYRPDDSCLAELLPNSARLTSLNNRGYAQNGNVDYLLVAGNYLNSDSDGVVSLKSALAQVNRHLDDLTNGTIRRWTIQDKGHLKLDDAAPLAYHHWVDSWLNHLDLTSSPDPAEASREDGSWSFQVEVHNPTSKTLTLESLVFEEFDAFGVWTSNNWYKTGLGWGEFFPNTRCEWNEQLAPGESRLLGIQAWSDYQKTAVWDAEPAHQAFTIHLLVEAHTSGNQHFESEVSQRLTYNGRTPVPPDIRRPHATRPTKPMGLGRRK